MEINTPKGIRKNLIILCLKGCALFLSVVPDTSVVIAIVVVAVVSSCTLVS